MTDEEFTKWQADNRSILKWLGYREPDHGVFVKSGVSVYVAVIHIERRDRLILPGYYPADPELDLLVMMQVRASIFSSRKQFMENCHAMWKSRMEIVSPNWADAWLIAYQPGDYAEAARFLWEKSDHNPNPERWE